MVFSCFFKENNKNMKHVFVVKNNLTSKEHEDDFLSQPKENILSYVNSLKIHKISVTVPLVFTQ